MNRGFSAFSSRRPLDRGSSRGGPGRSSRSPFTSSARADEAELTPQDALLPGPKTTPCTVLTLETATHPGLRHLVPRITPPLIPSETQSFYPLPLLPKSPVSPSGLSLCSCPSNGFSSPLSPGVDSVAVGGGRGQEGRCHPHSLTPEEGTPKF